MSSARMHRPERREGVVILIALVAIAVISLLAGVSMAYLARQRDAIGRQTARTQSRWLAEAALERAAAKLRASADYEGETWSLPGGDTGLRADARAQIQVAKTDSSARRVSVVVDFPFPVSPRDVRTERSLDVSAEQSATQ